MKQTHGPDDALGRLIDRTLRAQPPVAAPATLEARVLAEIERRAALPWWDKSFLHWPVPARAVFLLASLGVVKLVLDVMVWAISGVRAEAGVASRLGWLRTFSDVAHSIADAGLYVVHSIPSYWLYAGAIAGVTAYLAAVGLGTIAYRTLYK